MKPTLTEAQRAQVTASMRIVAQLALAYRVEPHIRDELMSAGYEALTRAVLRHRDEEGAFEPFARVAVRMALLRTVGREFRARRPLMRMIDRGPMGLPAPKDVSLEDALAAQTGDERADIVVGLERVVAGYLGVESVRAANGEENMLARDAHRHILAALDSVKTAERDAFFAHVVNGQTHAEITKSSGVNKRTLQRMIERAEDAIRERLG